MNLGPYTLFDIDEQNEETQFKIRVINFEIEELLNHTASDTYLPLNNNSLETCKNKNDRQVELLYFSISKVKLFFKENPHSTKRKNQLEYLSNALDHFVNWYENNKFQIPDKIPLLEWSKGSFSANKNFSIIKIKNKSYSLRRNQPKIVELLFQNLTDELDGLSYKDLSKELDLTSYGKLSNYFKDLPRVGDLFNYSRRNGKYTLKT
jgi:hypothetical protein